MEEKVLKYIKENSMVVKGDRILVALSGGPDSVCLLNILHRLKETLDISIYAAHINHCLRGEEALKDEQYSKKLCKSLDIPFYSKSVDINEISKTRGISTEMAGREERYAFFNELKQEFSLDKIAIAHNLNDQAETIIMRIMRGTGLEGLVGIKPVRDEIYIRPILCLSRKEIEEYCEKETLDPRIDKSNYEDIYSRNKIRIKAIPFIEENFNKDIVTTLNRLSHMCNIDNEFIENIVQDKFRDFCYYDNDSLYIKKEAFNEKEAIITRVVRRALMEFSSVHHNFEMKHIYDIMCFQEGNTGKIIDLPNGIKARNIYGNVKLELNVAQKEEISFNSTKINISELSKLGDNLRLEIDNFGYNIDLEVIDSERSINFNNNNLIKYFDYDKIKHNIIIRNRIEGDKIVPIGMSGTKKIKDIFINAKIPKNERDYIPLVTFDEEIAWVVGVKVSDRFKVTKDSKNILKINFSRKEI